MNVVDHLLMPLFWGSSGLLTYGLLVYPGLMGLISRLPRREQPASTPTAWPRVNVIIPAHNEEPVIAAKLANTFAGDYPPELLDVIVVSDGSTDRTVELAKQFSSGNVQVLELQPNQGKSAALNLALQHCTAEVLCLCDANVMFRRDALRRLVERLNDPAVGAVSGDVRLASENSDFEVGETSYYSIERMIQLGESRIGSMIGVDGGMYVIRRELFHPLPEDTVLDDFTTSMRVIQQQRRITYEPRAVATENATPSWRQEFRRRVRVKCGAVQSVRRGLWPPLNRPVELWQYLSHKAVRWLGPIWMAALMMTSLLLSGRGILYRTVLLAQLAFYACAAAAWCWPQLRKSRIGGIAFYFTLSHLAMLVGLMKGLLTKPSGIWERTPRVSDASLPESGEVAAETSARRPQTTSGRTISAISGAN